MRNASGRCISKAPGRPINKGYRQLTKDPFRDACEAIEELQNNQKSGQVLVRGDTNVGLHVGFALHSETLRPLMIYEGLDGKLSLSEVGVFEPVPEHKDLTVSIDSSLSPNAVKHTKGGIYTHYGTIQHQQEELALYLSHSDQRLWLRPRDMFEDGRFIPAPDNAPITSIAGHPLRPQDRHNPGGKVRISLPDGMIGAADFSSCGSYRFSLVRDWTPTNQPAKSILWIGMNPSVADASASDPTCNREQNYSSDWGFTRYIKANMLDWRATSPKDLPHNPDVARSPENLPAILRHASECEMVILAYGKMHGRYQGHIQETINSLRKAGHDLHVLGLNADGSAKHPLYLKKSLTPFPFPD